MNALTRAGVLAAATAVAAVGALAATTAAQAGDGQRGAYTVTARLTGYQEDPSAISTAAAGSIRLRVDPQAQTIRYTIRWANLESPVLMSHIHLGTRAQSGGISVWLCGNVPTTPAGVQPCPTTNPAEVSGTITPADVVGPAPQGITAGEFEELLGAISADATYANVHTVDHPSGEIRSQLEPQGHH
jgi:CHRD domain